MKLTIILVVALSATLAGRASEPAKARPCLVIRLGTTDGAAELALGADGASVVQGLAADEASLARSRAALQKAGVYGRVSVIPWRTAPKLPYIDGIVNRLVVPAGVKTDEDELRRVVAPGGWLEREAGGVWIAPAPDRFGVWTHPAGDAGATRASADARIEKPAALKWCAGPMFDIKPKVAAEGVVVAMSQYGLLPSRAPRSETVSAYDAWNGTLLWQRAIPFPGLRPEEVWGGTGVSEERERSYAYCFAVHRGRLYVAAHPRTLILDLATGQDLGGIETASPAERVLVVGETVVLALTNSVAAFGLDGSPRWKWPGRTREVLATESAAIVSAVDEGGAFIQLLAVADGKPLGQWRPNCAPEPAPERRRHEVDPKTPANAPIRPLAAGHGRVVVWLSKYDRVEGGAGLACLDDRTGRELWRYRPSAKDDDCLFPANHVMATATSVWALVRSGKYGVGSSLVELDPATGSERRRSEPLAMLNPNCSGGTMTGRFLLPRDHTVGIDDLKDLGNNKLSLRSGCGSWSMPACGAIFTGAHDCACYGFYRAWAMVHLKAQVGASDAGFLRDEGTRNEPGPAIAAKGERADDEQWPQYLRDAARSNHYPKEIPIKDLVVAWQATIPAQGGSQWRQMLAPAGRLTAPVAANDTVCVADGDGHSVHALSVRDGHTLWRFTAGGVIDSPPALVDGKAVFGCADGWVYALALKDGAVAWKTRLARNDTLRPMHGQLSSPWPVHGSVMVEGERVVTMAGWYGIESERLFLYGLSLADGKPVWEQPLESVQTIPGDWYNRQARKEPCLVKRNEVLGLVDGQAFGYDPASGKQLDPAGRWHFLNLSPLPEAAMGKTFGTLVRQSAMWKDRRADLCGTGAGGGELFFYAGQVRNLAPPTGNAPMLPKPLKRLVARGGEAWSAMLVAGESMLVAGSGGTAAKPACFLRAYRAEELSPFEEIPLPSRPSFRGMIAAGGRIYLSCDDGSVVCLAPKGAPR
jgi:outer membrane protein assembly factor BamB